MRSGVRTRTTVQEAVTLLSVFILVVGFVGLVPLAANAGAVVIYFSGLCLGDAQTCNAAKNAYGAIKSKLADGTDIIAPVLSGGRYTNNGELQKRVLPTVKNSSNTVVLVAYSAGHYALETTVNAMNADDMKRVKSIVSLEANYPGFDRAVARVRSANPTVEVHRFSGSSCGTDHAGIPGSSCMASKIASLAKSAHDGTPVNLASLGPPPPAPPPPAYKGNQTFGNMTLASLFPTSQLFTGGNSPPFSGLSSPNAPPSFAPPLQTALYSPVTPSVSPFNYSPPVSTKLLASAVDDLSASSSTVYASYDPYGTSTTTIVSIQNTTSTFGTGKTKNESATADDTTGVTSAFYTAIVDIIERIRNIVATLAVLFQQPAKQQ